MSEEKETPTKIVYVGHDDPYLNDLKEDFLKTYPSTPFNFQTIYNAKDDKHYNMFVEIMNSNSNIIYIDVASTNQYMIRLAQLLRRQQKLRGVPIVCLLPDKSRINIVRDAGIKFIYIKNAEIHDVTYHPYLYINPEAAVSQQFATGSSDTPSRIFEEVKIGYVHKDYIHLESNQCFRPESLVQFYHFNLNSFLPSPICEVRDVSGQDIYYNMDYGMNLYFKFVQEPDYEEYEKSREEKFQKILNSKEKLSKMAYDYEVKTFESHYPATEEIKKRIEKQREKCRKDLDSWINKQKDEFTPKSTKVLIVDSKLEHLKNNDYDLTNLPYTLSNQTILGNEYSIVKKIRPHVIAYSFPLPELPIQSEKDRLIQKEIEQKQAEELFKHIQYFENYNPIVIFFRCSQFSKEELINRFHYDNIITHKGPIDLKSIIDMGHLFDKKKKKKEAPEEVRYYFPKETCHALIAIDIKIKSLSESEITFTSEQELNLGTFKMRSPIDMYVTTIPQEGKDYLKDGAIFIYKGFIHGLDEEDKKALRREVDKIFLREKIQKREKELEEFKKKNAELQKKAKE